MEKNTTYNGYCPERIFKRETQEGSDSVLSSSLEGWRRKGGTDRKTKFYNSPQNL
jgi:hypothetical protein